MTAITEGTTKLRQAINKDETLHSADLLVYGKVPIFRGNLGFDKKRFSRITCVTNDQIPTVANVIVTVSSNSITLIYIPHRTY